MNRKAVVGEARSIWDTMSYADKLHYIYGYISSDELAEDFLESMEHMETEDIAANIDYLVEISNKNRGKNG